jgi:hypothetical protein
VAGFAGLHKKATQELLSQQAAYEPGGIDICVAPTSSHSKVRASFRISASQKQPALIWHIFCLFIFVSYAICNLTLQMRFLVLALARHVF